MPLNADLGNVHWFLRIGVTICSITFLYSLNRSWKFFSKKISWQYVRHCSKLNWRNQRKAPLLRIIIITDFRCVLTGTNHQLCVRRLASDNCLSKRFSKLRNVKDASSSEVIDIVRPLFGLLHRKFHNTNYLPPRAISGPNSLYLYLCK